MSLFLLEVFREANPLGGNPGVNMEVDRGTNCGLHNEPLEHVAFIKGCDIRALTLVFVICVLAAGVVSVVLPVEHSVCDAA